MYDGQNTNINCKPSLQQSKHSSTNCQIFEPPNSSETYDRRLIQHDIQDIEYERKKKKVYEKVVNQKQKIQTERVRKSPEKQQSAKKHDLRFDDDIENMLDILQCDTDFQKLTDNEQITWLESLFYQDVKKTASPHPKKRCYARPEDEKKNQRAAQAIDKEGNVTVNSKLIHIAQSYFPEDTENKGFTSHSNKTKSGSAKVRKDENGNLRIDANNEKESTDANEERKKRLKIGLLANVTEILQKK